MTSAALRTALAVGLCATSSGCFATDLAPDEVYEPRAGDERAIARAVEMAMMSVGAAPGEIVQLQRVGPTFAAVYETLDDAEALEISGAFDDVGPYVLSVCKRVQTQCVPMSIDGHLWDEGAAPTSI